MSEMTITPDLYLLNKEMKFPQKQGRNWREAEFNFVDGHRNNKRILYSNDGLVFVTEDHYQTFYEITM